MHPHPNKRHVMRAYRRYIVDRKKRWGTARGLVHYRQIIETYLWAKRSLMER